MMRWMESLVERAGAGGGIPTIQRLWSWERKVAVSGRAHPAQTRLRGELPRRAVNVEPATALRGE